MAEPERRLVIAALILSASDRPVLVERTGLTTRQVTEALERLASSGLVEQGSDGTYVLLEESFKAASRAAGGTEDRGPDRIEDRILHQAIADGRLVHLPRRRSKRLIVLDRLAQEFEPGRHYGEREVNRTLRAFDDDVATLRRHLIDEGFLDRADGLYWRAGGTVETES